jgi:hypothetical protein
MGLTHGSLASDSYYSQSSGAGDTGTYATPTITPSLSQTPPPTQLSQNTYGAPTTPQVAPTYAAPTPDTLARADYTKPSDLGDTETQRLVREQGASVEQALKIQADNATNERARAYYENELRKAIQSNISVSGEYHYRAMKSGLPQAINPFENVADLSLKAVGSGSFKLGSYKTADIDALAQAKATGDTGAYGKLKSYSSVYGDLSVAEQQDIARLVAKSRPDYAVDETQMKLAPVAKDFGYGGKEFIPSDYIKSQINTPSPVPAAVVDERRLPSLSGGKINDEPIMIAAGSPDKYVLKDNLFQGTAGTVALGSTLEAQNKEITAMTAGKLNEAGEFTGTPTEFAKLTALQAAYNTGLGTYKSTLDKEYATYQEEASKPKLYFTPIAKEDIFGTPEPKKNFIEQAIAMREQGLDIGGGFIRQVGSITETPWTPNIIDAITTVPKAIDKYTGLPIFANPVVGFLNPVMSMAMRPGAEERPATKVSASSDTLKYGSYTEASDEFSRNVLQPVFGSPEKYAGHAQLWENEFNKPGATAGEKIVAGSMLVGAKANEYVLKNPGDIPVILTQAATIEATGLFPAIGALQKSGLTRLATAANIADRGIVTKGIEAISKHSIDIGFGTLIAGESTKTEEGWFRQTKPTEILKNVGPLGAQLVTFTAGTYGMPKNRISGASAKEAEAFGGEPAKPSGSSGKQTYSENGQTYTRTDFGKESFFEGASRRGAGSQIQDTINILREEAAQHKMAGNDMLAREAEAKIKALEKKAAQGQTTTGGGMGEVTYHAAPIKDYVAPENIGKVFKQSPIGAGAIPGTEGIPTPKFTEPKYSAQKPIETAPPKPTPPSPVPAKGEPEIFKTEVKPIKGTEKLPEVYKPKSIEKYVEPTYKETNVDLFKGEKRGEVDIFKERKTDVMKYEKPKTDVMKYEKPKTDVMKFKKPKTDVVKFRTPPKDIVPFKEKPLSVVEYKPKPKDIVEYKPAPKDIVEYKPKPKDIVPYERKPTEIKPFERKPFEEKPFERKPEEAKGKPGGGIIPPIGIPDLLGGGGGAGGGGGGGRGGRAFTEVYRYGFGIKVKPSQLPEVKVQKINMKVSMPKVSKKKK